jgi:hypothetical protein
MPSVHDLITQRFAEYATALGKVVHSWNILHEQLGWLFGAVAGMRSDDAFAIWYQKPNDRWQRGKLREALKTSNLDQIDPRADDDLLWLLDQVGLLAEDRNDAVHAPCGMLLNNQFEITPVYFNGNPRAANLRDKPILPYFSWYERRALTFSIYAESSFNSIAHRKVKWPERPSIPALEL